MNSALSLQDVLPSDIAAILGESLWDKGADFHPYTHQLEALQNSEHGDLLITGGTGSGKTKAFLLPILNGLISEARQWAPSNYEQLDNAWWEGGWHDNFAYQRGGEDPGRPAAVRCLIAYPTNALVEDQLTTLRRALSPRVWAPRRQSSPLLRALHRQDPESRTDRRSGSRASLPPTDGCRASARRYTDCRKTTPCSTSFLPSTEARCVAARTCTHSRPTFLSRTSPCSSSCSLAIVKTESGTRLENGLRQATSTSSGSWLMKFTHNVAPAGLKSGTSCER